MDAALSPKKPLTPEQLAYFNACLVQIKTISSNLNKPLVDRQNYPPYAVNFDTASNERAQYLDRCLEHWKNLGLISLSLFPTEDHTPTPSNGYNPFYQRIFRSIAYSFQHPKGTDRDGNRNAWFCLERFIDAFVESRQGNVWDVPFRAFCIVDTKEETIPDHYGHSAWPFGANPERTVEEHKMDTLYRRALVFPTLKGKLPHGMHSLEKRAIEQCAENIALPYIVSAAKKILAACTGNRVITIYVLTLGIERNPMRLCANCERHVQSLVMDTLGLRIVDRVEGEDAAYQSDATRALWVASQFPEIV